MTSKEVVHIYFYEVILRLDSSVVVQLLSLSSHHRLPLMALHQYFSHAFFRSNCAALEVAIVLLD